MDVKWQLPLYSYSEKYDCTLHYVEVIAEDKNLKILHIEDIQSICEGNVAKVVTCFSGVYEINTLLLTCESGEVLEQHQSRSKTCPDPLKTEHIKEEEFPHKKHYIYGEYDIFMESKWTMCCQEMSSKQILWKKNIRHYLYTEIACKNDILYFGTQGNGGGFYALSIVDGSTIFALKNNCFHPEFYWVDEVILMDDPKGNWNLVDPITGEMLSCAFRGEIKYRSENDFVVLATKYNRATKQYHASLMCVRK